MLILHTLFYFAYLFFQAVEAEIFNTLHSVYLFFWAVDVEIFNVIHSSLSTLE